MIMSGTWQVQAHILHFMFCVTLNTKRHKWHDLARLCCITDYVRTLILISTKDKLNILASLHQTPALGFRLVKKYHPLILCCLRTHELFLLAMFCLQQTYIRFPNWFYLTVGGICSSIAQLCSRRKNSKFVGRSDLMSVINKLRTCKVPWVVFI